MRFRDWPPRRIGVMWLIGLAVQLLAILIVPPLLGFEVAAPHEPWPDADRITAEAPQHVPERVPERDPRSSDSLTITREAGPAGDTVTRISLDSSFVVMRRNGDTLEVLDASQDVKESARQFGTVFAGIMANLARALIVMMVLLFAIPLVLLVVTLTWVVLQRRRAPA
jgi:hypothetical protein